MAPQAQPPAMVFIAYSSNDEMFPARHFINTATLSPRRSIAAMNRYQRAAPRHSEAATSFQLVSNGLNSC
jgi:hypothetical protein